jgi:hypothetical protein
MRGMEQQKTNSREAKELGDGERADAEEAQWHGPH